MHFRYIAFSYIIILSSYFQVDSRPPPATVFTSEDLCAGLQVDSCPPPGTVFTSDDLCTGLYYYYIYISLLRIPHVIFDFFFIPTILRLSIVGRKRRRGYKKDKENSPPQSIRNNLAAIGGRSCRYLLLWFILIQ